MNTYQNTTSRNKPITWRERNKELDTTVQWRKFMDKYKEERLSVVFQQHDHHPRDVWEWVGNFLHGRVFERRHGSYV